MFIQICCYIHSPNTFVLNAVHRVATRSRTALEHGIGHEQQAPLRRWYHGQRLVQETIHHPNKFQSALKFYKVLHGGFLKWEYPQMDGLWKIHENPTKMDDLGVPLWLRKPPSEIYANLSISAPHSPHSYRLWLVPGGWPRQHLMSGSRSPKGADRQGDHPSPWMGAGKHLQQNANRLEKHLAVSHSDG